MNLRRESPTIRPLVTAAVVVSGGLLVFGCERDDTIAVDRNLPPETYVTQGPPVSPNPNNPTDQFYRAHLYWRGEDRDGTVAGFRFAIDDTTDRSSWRWTTKTDSIFRFQAGEVGSREHLFLIRAVDNLGKQDASPDTLRFEAFTAAAPSVEYVREKIRYSNAEGTFFGLDKGATVLVNTTITFVWTGSDADGEVVRWESIFGNELPIQHARDDTVRTIGPLPSGKHDFLVRAFDDAGAVSTSGGLFTVTSNFDPVCRIDSTSIRSELNITWLDSDPDVDSVLVYEYDLTDPDVQDTIPYGAKLSFCWECTDRDGPVVLHTWRVGFIQSQTEGLCANTDSVCAFDPDSGFVVCRAESLGAEGVRASLVVRGRDIYGRVESRPLIVDMPLNFRPVVTIDPPTMDPIRTTDPVTFTFHGEDVDSDPRFLEYRWWFDDDLPTAFGSEQQTSPPRLFSAGQHFLYVQAVDQSGIERISPTAELPFEVIP